MKKKKGGAKKCVYYLFFCKARETPCIRSAGCIFAELLGRKPLFPGKNFVHQLTLIFGVIGSPPDSAVAHITNKQARKFLASVISPP